MNRGCSETEEDICEEAEVEADNTLTRAYFQVYTIKKRSSLWQAREKVYTYTSVKDVIVQRVKKHDGCKVASLLRDIREYDMEGERTTIITKLEMYRNTRETNHIGLDIFYQVNITDYINRSTEFNQNLHKSYTVFWEFWNKQLQNTIEINSKYETKCTTILSRYYSLLR